MDFEIGQQVRTPESLPVCYGTVIEIYNEGEFVKVRKEYGRKKWARKYTRKQLEDAEQADKDRRKASRDRYKANHPGKRRGGCRLRELR